jgi:hypothetical protein
MLTLVLGVIMATGGNLGVLVVAVPGAGLLFGSGVVVNLLGMQLMEAWRQGRVGESSEG